jgi:L-ribulose-5-phosphate 3-epimerase UlaE
MRHHPLGIYEKALPKDLSWPERLVLAKSCGFDFVEMSVDETDERLSRLDWTPRSAPRWWKRCWKPAWRSLDVLVRPPPLPVWQPR